MCASRDEAVPGAEESLARGAGLSRLARYVPANRFYNAFDFETPDTPQNPREGEYRTPFEIDRDRIIHTSAFRRLQSKTQVFLSGEYDFYRTRLTHSIEVAQIGRGICAALQRRSPLLEEDFYIDPDLVEAACLAHDLGHPPFGHAGERTLNRMMLPWGGFEGNAQTLRMITETIFSVQSRGMSPTRAFLDGTLKYKTLYSELDQPENHFLYDHQHERLDWAMGGRDFPLELPAGDVRDGFRSIECQIMDWADDTAYSLNDIADGLNAGLITLHSLERWAEGQELDQAGAEIVQQLLKGIRKGTLENRLRGRIGAFIDAVRLEPDTNFMSGVTNRYRFRLVIDPAMRAESKLCKKIALHLVFRSRRLQQLEYKCVVMLTQIFEALAARYISRDAPHGLRLLGEPDEVAIEAAESETGRARIVCDALARMTDGSATRFWQRLFDPDFRSIVDLG